MYKIRRTTTHSQRAGQRIHFDEKNLLMICHPEKRDNEFVSNTSAYTQNPVDAAVLRFKLREAMQRANEQQFPEAAADPPVHMTVIQSFEGCGQPKLVRFLEKRRKFYAAEFVIAQQHHMSQSVHVAGENVSCGSYRVKPKGLAFAFKTNR